MPHTLRFIGILMVVGGQAVCRAMGVLVHHMPVMVPDKSEFRREAAEAILSLMWALPRDLFSSIVRWFVRYAHSETSSNSSLEVVGRLMYSTRLVEEGGTIPDASTLFPPSAKVSVVSSVEPSKEPTTPSFPPESNTTTARPRQSILNSFLFVSIYGRCGDISASGRAQAPKILGEITGEQPDRVKEVLNTISAQDKASRGQLSLTDVLKDPNMDLPIFDFLPSGDELIQFLRRRAFDHSVFVKKPAFQVLENLLLGVQIIVFQTGGLGQQERWKLFVSPSHSLRGGASWPPPSCVGGRGPACTWSRSVLCT